MRYNLIVRYTTPTCTQIWKKKPKNKAWVIQAIYTFRYSYSQYIMFNHSISGYQYKQLSSVHVHLIDSADLSIDDQWSLFQSLLVGQESTHHVQSTQLHKNISKEGDGQC